MELSSTVQICAPYTPAHQIGLTQRMPVSLKTNSNKKRTLNPRACILKRSRAFQGAMNKTSTKGLHQFAAYLNKNNFSFELYTVFRYCFALFQKHLYDTCRLYTSRAQLPWHSTFGGTMPTTARVFLHASCCA